jgi:hypothetical protein
MAMVAPSLETGLLFLRKTSRNIYGKRDPVHVRVYIKQNKRLREKFNAHFSDL